MSKAEDVHSTPTNVVALSDFRSKPPKGEVTPDTQEFETESLPAVFAQREAVSRRYNSDDPVFFEIERHRRAVETYKKAIDAENAAEGNVTDEEFSYLERCTERAFNDLVLFTQCLVIFNARSRAGLIALAKYIEQQFVDDVGGGGSPYMPERPGDEPWPRVFMRSMARNLRHMGKDFPPTKRARKGWVSSKAQL